MMLMKADYRRDSILGGAGVYCGAATERLSLGTAYFGTTFRISDASWKALQGGAPDLSWTDLSRLARQSLR